MKLKLKRLAGWSFVGLIVLALAFALRPKPVPADMAVVERGYFRVTIDEEGETQVRDRFVVSAPLAGQVLRIEWEPGDPVEAGQTVLATFLPNDPALLDVRARAGAEAQVKAAQASLGQAQAQRKRAEAELAFARAQLTRYQRLAEQEIISRDQLEAVELEEHTKQDAMEAADFAVHNARYGLEVAQANLIQTEMESPGQPEDRGNRQPILIRSPVDGVVLRRLRESQAVIPAGEPLVEVGNPADLEIVSDLLSTDAVKIRAGNETLIEQWGGGKPLRGRVRRVEPSGFTKISALGVEEQRVNIIVDFEDPREAWEALGDSYRVEVRIIIWEREDVVQVPTSSLFRHGEDWAVFTVEAGMAALRRVEIGQQNGLEAEILSGLSEGNVVIVHPSDAIADGVAVRKRDS